MKTVLEGSLLFERSEDGKQSLQFEGNKCDDSGKSFVVGALSTIASSITHADWFITRKFALLSSPSKWASNNFGTRG